MMQASACIEAYVARFGQEVMAQEVVSRDRLGRQLCAYNLLVSRCFISLMALAACGSASSEARQTLWPNLVCEVDGDHCDMLRRFAKGADHYANDPHVRAVVARNSAIIEALLLLCFRDASAGHALIALWESLSVVFMPRITQAGALHAAPDTQYPDVHGVNDESHMVEAKRGLELECITQGVEVSRAVLELGYEFMANIFTLP